MREIEGDFSDRGREKKASDKNTCVQGDKSPSTHRRERRIRRAARGPTSSKVSAASARPGAGDRPLWGSLGLRSVELGGPDASFVARASPGSAVIACICPFC